MSFPASLYDDLRGKVALVTGASSGIGRHMATTLAACGCRVVAGARRVAKLEALVAEVTRAGGTAAAVPLDVTDGASVRAFFADAHARFGSIDILVNNAGVSVDDKPALQHDDGDWEFVVGTDLKGPWLCCREAARYMGKQAGGGAIVNVASVLGLRVMKWIPEYCAAKAGLIHLTKQLALEWARSKIRVNALAPGFYLTDINRQLFEADPKTGKKPKGGQNLIRRVPLKRLGDLRDLDGPLLLLCSARAGAFMTGECIAVDGGHLQSSL